PLGTHPGTRSGTHRTGGAIRWRRPLLRRWLPAGPGTGQAAVAGRAAAVDGRLDQSEDRALDGRGEQHLTPAVPAVGGLGGALVAGYRPPDPLEDQARDQAAGHAAGEADRLVQDAFHRRLHQAARRRSQRRCRRRRATSQAVSAPAVAATAAVIRGSRAAARALGVTSRTFSRVRASPSPTAARVRAAAWRARSFTSALSASAA